MTDVNLPEDVCHLIESSVPTIDALELLVFLARNANKQWTSVEIVYAMRPTVIRESAVKECLTLFESRALVSKTHDGLFQYRPPASELENSVSALIKAYNEHPVTLIRAVYAIAETERVRSFADAFKIKKD